MNAIERVLHFSSGGGIYVARKGDEQVVLKEARPFSGLDAKGEDAVHRLEREHELMRLFEGVPGVPRAFEMFDVGEHRFLAMEFVDGRPLSREIVRRYPLIKPDATSADYAEFTDWALKIYDQVEAAIDAIHDRGYVYGDLHLFNVLVRDDDSIGLLDFEVAMPIAEATRPGLANQGFAAPRGTTGVDIDRYALGCLRLAMFLPMTSVVWLDRGKARHFARVIAEHFPVPKEFLARALEVIDPPTALIPSIRPGRTAGTTWPPPSWPAPHPRGLTGSSLVTSGSSRPGAESASPMAPRACSTRSRRQGRAVSRSGRDNPLAGLLRGGSGPALLLMRAFDETGDPELLDRAATAIRMDLKRCVLREDGVLEVNEGWRTMPYLETGSVGIGLAIDAYLERREDERFRDAVSGIDKAAKSKMYILPGLFSGRAGIAAYLAHKRDPEVTRQILNLSWHAIPFGGGLAFPGTGLMRLSMDLATGTAGVLLAIAAAQHGLAEPVRAPLLTLSPLTSRTPASTAAGR